jgi:hypothetical protein
MFRRKKEIPGKREIPGKKEIPRKKEIHKVTLFANMQVT